MTADLIEAGVEELTEDDLKRRIRCQCLLLGFWQFRKAKKFRQGEEAGFRCWAFATGRLRVHCLACGARYHLFLCSTHVKAFKHGGRRIWCRNCHQGGHVRGTDS